MSIKILKGKPRDWRPYRFPPLPQGLAPEWKNDPIALQRAIADGFQEGMEKGYQEGLDQGQAQGRQQGYDSGLEQGRESKSAFRGRCLPRGKVFGRGGTDQSVGQGKLPGGSARVRFQAVTPFCGGKFQIRFGVAAKKGE